MSSYTTQIRWIVESKTLDHKNKSMTERIKIACPLIFDFDFPIFDEKYRLELEKKILMHYFNYEIGYETYGLWKFKLEERMNLIMPFYNQLYKDLKGMDSFLINFYSNEKTDKLGNFSGSGKTVESGTGTLENKTLVSDTPQINYSGQDYATELSEGNQTQKSDSTNTMENTSENTENVQTIQKGFNDLFVLELLKKYGNDILDIDNLIINNLKDMFMLIW